MVKRIAMVKTLIWAWYERRCKLELLSMEMSIGLGMSENVSLQIISTNHNRSQKGLKLLDTLCAAPSWGNNEKVVTSTIRVAQNNQKVRYNQRKHETRILDLLFPFHTQRLGIERLLHS